MAKFEAAEFQLSTLDALTLAEKAFVSHDALALFNELCQLGEEYWLVGGSVRDSICGQHPPTDLDLVVPNDSKLVHGLLDTYGPSRRNRHGNYRYYLGFERHVDVIEPRFFYRPFRDVADVLAYFDTSVNALGIGLGSGRVLDPLGGLSDLRHGRTRLTPARWNAMSDFEAVHLACRVTRLLDKMPLVITNPEVLLAQLPKFESVDWTDLERLNGFGRDEARRRLLAVTEAICVEV